MWLIQQETYNAISRAINLGMAPTAEQREHFVEHRAEAWGVDSVLAYAGDQAEISVVGVLTNAPDFMAYLFGGGNTCYPDIIGALAQADANPDTKEISMYIDSPGGQVHGLFETIAAMQQTKKPIKVRASLAASAAYALASQGDSIEAVNRASSFGSIGVMVNMREYEDVYTVTSTNAPKKAPDASTPEGQAVIREQLDELHELFVESIASGRGTDVDAVNMKYGQGATMLADRALENGMIDSIGAVGLSVVSSNTNSNVESASAGGNTNEDPKMDKAKLKAEHPELFAQVVALGETQERERVEAHLTLGEGSGAMDIAMAAIKDGSGLTTALQAKYMSAGMNKRDGDNRAADDADAATALGDVPAGQEQGTEAKDKAASDNIFAIASGDVIPEA